MSDAPRRVATSGASNPEAAVVALQLALSPDRRPDLAAVADLMSRPALRGAVLQLELSTFALEARHRRAIQEFLKGLVRASRAAGLEIPLILLNDRVLPLLKAWSTASRGLRLSARLSAGEAVSGAVLDMLCQALFGATRRIDSEEAAVDLTAAWPDLDLAFLGRLPLIPAIKARLAARDKASSAVERSRGITLGRLDDDLPFAIDAMARKQHVYMLGGTGTGKSTLMLNMIVQDMKAGRAVIVVDPHGDLWEKALRLVPSKRLQDLVLVHPTDPRGQFTMNILERLSDDAEGEHGRVIDELLDFLKRSQWRDVPEAFGPMFENYFRNGLQLLLSAEGDDASILDFPRVFSDDGFRRKLLGKCKNADVRPVLARHRRGGPVRGEAVQPCALHRLQGEPDRGQRASAADPGRPQLDARLRQHHPGAEDLPHQPGAALSREGGVPLPRRHDHRPPGRVGQGDASLRAEEQRKRVNVYMDEFQTYISAGLADGLAEVRKYGLNLVLANQSLSQLQGDRHQAEIAEAVMSNAANVIAFRVGIQDAQRLGRRFEPELPAAALAKLPNYHAAGIVVRGSAVSAPEVFATAAEPKPPRRKAAVEPHDADGALAAARAGIVRLLGERAAGTRAVV